jgi:hypothetical protein
MVLFADRIISVAVTNTLVRLEFGVQKPVEQKDGQPMPLELASTIVMPLEGMLASMSMLEDLLRKLAKDGVIKVAPPQDQTVS